MITRNIKNIILPLAVGCGLATATTSCSDFLDILPMNDVVLENYWTEKADVTSVMNSCYETLEHSDALVRFCVWGELRSDDIRLGANVPNEINEILKELARSAYKWKALDILVLARSLANDHQRGFSAASVNDHVGASVPKAAVVACLASGLERLPLLIKIVCHINLLFEHDHGNTVVLKSPVPVA